MKSITKKLYFTVIALVVAFGWASLGAVAKNDNGKKDKPEGAVHSQREAKVVKSVNLKNFEQPDKAKGETNAQLHQEKVKEVTKNLDEAVTQEKAEGNVAVSDQLGQVVTDQEQTQSETTNAIEQVESRGKVKTFLLGTDYKNLGQLRSSLVHNRNDIRKLTTALSQAQTEDSKAVIEAQLTTLMQERERIKTVIADNESSFSLFGWVSRFLSNYEETPINQQEEDNLATEVEDSINDAENQSAENQPAENHETLVPENPTAPTTSPAPTPSETNPAQ